VRASCVRRRRAWAESTEKAQQAASMVRYGAAAYVCVAHGWFFFFFSFCLGAATAAGIPTGVYGGRDNRRALLLLLAAGRTNSTTQPTTMTTTFV
jgi:hypothetical protein